MTFLERYDAAPPQDRFKVLYHGIKTDPAGTFGELRRERPILVTPVGVLLTRFADVVETLSHHEVFTVQPYRPKMDPSVGPFMLARDGTVYNQRDKGIMRALIQQSDMPGVREKVAALAADAIRAGAADGRLELVSQVTRRVPVELTGAYFGFPGPDPATMMDWSRATQHDMFHNAQNDEAVHQTNVRAGAEMKEYLEAFLPEQKRRAETDPALDDVVSRLLRLSLPESIGFDFERVMTNTMGLLVGGVETTSAAIVQALDQLLRRPEEMARALAAAEAGDEAQFDRIFWEALRFNPINPFVARICVADYRVAAGSERQATIPAGTLVLISTASAMLDENELAEPERFRSDRPPYHYLHLGHGNHRCLGDQVSLVQAPEIARQILLAGYRQRAEGAAGQLDFMGGPFPESFTLVRAA